jgi:hypothetical protein
MLHRELFLFMFFLESGCTLYNELISSLRSWGAFARHLPMNYTGKGPRLSLNMKLCTPRNWSGSFGEERKIASWNGSLFNFVSRKVSFLLTDPYEILIIQPPLISRLVFSSIHTNFYIFRVVSLSLLYGLVHPRNVNALTAGKVVRAVWARIMA